MILSLFHDRYFFMIFIIFEKCVNVSSDPVIAQKNQGYHRKERQKTWGSMSRLGALPLGEGGGAKHSPPGHASYSLVHP